MDGRSKFVFTMMTGESSLKPLGTPARASVTSFRHIMVSRNMPIRAQCNCKRTERRHHECPAPSWDGTHQKRQTSTSLGVSFQYSAVQGQPAESFGFYLHNNRASFFHPILNQAILCCASGTITFQIRCTAKPMP